MDSRQAAAIARRKRDARVDRDLAEERARLALVVGQGDQLPADPSVATVGWLLPDPASVKGQGHLCIQCSPERPTWDHRPVLRMALAARSKCTSCGRALETMPRERVTGDEKK